MPRKRTKRSALDVLIDKHPGMTLTELARKSSLILGSVISTQSISSCRTRGLRDYQKVRAIAYALEEDIDTVYRAINAR